MVDNPDGRRRRHFILGQTGRAERYRSRQQIVPTREVPPQNRPAHGGALLGQVNELQRTAEVARQAQKDAGLEEGYGLQIEFESLPDVELAFESLAREKSGIELLNVRQSGDRTYATVFVPDGKLPHFEKLIREYMEERRDTRGRARDHQRLIDAIASIRAAGLRALWTDAEEVFPTSDDETFWWEVWLPVRGDRRATLAAFAKLAEGLGIRVTRGALYFPERTVVLVYASAGQMKRSVMTLNSIAELRRAKETAEFFDSLPPEEQPEWVDNLLERARFAGADQDVPYICILDTGVNNGHRLIAPALADADLHTVEPEWDVPDDDGHGTELAGLALFGDLTSALAGNEVVEVGHRLESVKLLRFPGDNEGDARHHGYLTVEAVARPEITAPRRLRLFSLAVTTPDGRDRGRPSAWSAAIDRVASDVDQQNENPRLIVVSAGNIDDPNAWAQYPESNRVDSVHDPAQAWNALTVGAYTNLARVTEPDAGALAAIAPPGGLSPFSTTSCSWESHRPLKPDVVFEGGNAASDALGPVWTHSLSLLTTYHLPLERQFTTTRATSAATALAARMAAQLMTDYPELWPETIRGLIVHSAEWTDEMRRQFLPRRNPNKTAYENLVRHCGFGVPDLNRALWSASNSLTLVTESALHPFEKPRGGAPRTREMHLHNLPWPVDELQALGETEVQMRVTLSYFIEPNPSARGVRSRYRYESHGLRFDVKRPYESDNDFRARVNDAARQEEEGVPGGGADPGWLLGGQKRHRGSIHSDIWKGTAADLASRGVVGVFPAMGWWKTRPAQQKYNNPARYALLISIHAPEADIDLYNAVAAKVAQPVAVET